MPKLYSFLLVFMFIGNTFAFAQWQDPKVKLSNTYRFLLREHHGIYIQRAEVDFLYNRNTNLISSIKVSPFIELRNNLQKDRLEHKEVGIELGVDITPWFYLGESFQYTRYSYDWTNYIWHPQIKYAAEAETQLMFSFPVKKIDDDRDVTVYILDELTYSFRIGERTRNEVAVGFRAPLMKNLEGAFGWRHIDRIHDFDSDALEATLTLIF